MLNLLFILVISTCSAANNSSVCLDKLKELIELPFDEFLETILPYYQLSGDWVGKFGYYDRCYRKDHSYTSVEIDQQLYKQYYGFCHSNKCSAKDFNSKDGQENIKKILNDSGIANLINIDPDTITLNFYDPQTYFPNIGWETYVTSGILLILFIMIIIDPILRFITACQNKHTPDVRDRRSSSLQSPYGLREGLQDKSQYQPTSIIKDFSIIMNYNKIINLKTIDPNLTIFNGIRAISFMMVAYGHVNEMTAISTYITEANLQYKSWVIILLYDMMYAVDIFFWVGGFFLGYVMCEERKAKTLHQKPLSIFLSITHRLMRIWPCYLLCIAINSYIIPYLGSGPRWFLEERATQCPGGAWKNALFIDNFYEDWQLCFSWGWYLTCDFQLFLTCLIPILIYCFDYKVFSKILIMLMIIGTLGWAYYLSVNYDFLIPGRNTYNPNYYYKFYVSSYARAPPYFLGLLIGILYREFKQSKKSGQATYLQQFRDYAQRNGQRLIMQLCCYGLGFGIMSYLFFGWKKEFNQIEMSWPKWYQHIYHAFCRFLFTFGLTLIVLPNLVGAYDLLNSKFMNNTLFKFMAKISFTMYLVHLMIILILTETFYETPSFAQLDLLTCFVCAVVLSIVFGLFLSLMVELPFGNLDTRLIKIMMRPKRKVDTLLD
ncbi:unnamed protein product (macronuclear) [Paramecium tetraurelia]|uniref:Acyltransferase 3 domain-containing protein n=1 Tax=Paramecium tetraurelia TaxID=5888 RepID=A0C9W3_PARTE|nr:uncharacterized protein GSPATT00006887001 [Paramecium tetraurelia]CAK67580.1 unnamed protein product [Paramecium tetraurelia]|eukprot:XP_001434977.1 hypothetical protein (macronuclear) [Paramecium tetraurelia strain d4-2]